MPYFLTLCFACLSAIGCVWGETVTYKVATKNSVSILSGSAPSGSSTSFITTYTSTIGQITSGNHMTLTLSGYAGCKITGITMSMKSNASKGEGSFTMTVGTKTLASIGNSKFNTANWHGSWSTSYVDVTPSMTISDYVIQPGESVNITISASENSLYCESFTINYAPAATNPYTVTLHSGTSGTQLTETSGGAGVTLPQLTSYNSNYTFAGWSSTCLTSETTTAPDIIPAGVYHPSANTDLYAVFTHVEGQELWTKITDLSKITAGQYALLTTNYKAFNGNIDNGHGQITSGAFSFTNDTATSAPEGTIVLTLAPSGSGFSMYNEDLGYLYAKDNTSGNLAWRTTSSSYWIYKNSNWVFNSESALLRTYGQSSFRTYGTNLGEALIMAHKISASTTTYIYMPPLETVATPTFVPTPGDYTSPQDIVIACSIDDAIIYYTTDETDPTTESTLYTAGNTGLHYDADVTFKAIAIKEGMENSEVATGIFHINPNKTADTTATACGSFTWHGTTYFETPAVAPTFTDYTVDGYDSVITLHLTIYPIPTVNIISEPNQDFLCEGESMVLSLEGIRESQVLLNEDFSTCTGQESTEISSLATFPTMSKIFPTIAGNEVKMGSGNHIGKLTSATLDLSSPFIVTISAKRYNATENGPINVTVNGVTKSIANLSENYQTYTLEFDAATAQSTVTIATTTANMRAYLNSVNITVPGAGILWSTGEEKPSITVTPTTTTNYEVVVEDDNSCLGYANMNVTVYETPVAAIEGPANDMLCSNSTKIFTAQNGDETQYAYQWYKDNVKIDGATHSTYTLNNVSGDMSGDYTIVVRSLSGICQDSSAAVHFVVNEPANPDYVFNLSAPADIYDTIHVGYCEVTHTFANPTATHYLDGTPLGEVTFENNLHTTSLVYDTPGDYTISWTGTDACGNTAVCSQVLHIAYEPCPTAVDNDHNTYTSVRINCECWTTTNLNSTTYSDGTNINDVMSYQSDEHPDAEANSAIYGQLYTWRAAVAEGNAALNTPNSRGHIQGVCPAGWYLPTTDQIQGLLSTYTMSNLRYNNYWLDGGGDNISGLSLLPGGMYNAGTDRFENLGGNCYLWSAYEYDESTAKTFEADCYCGLFKVYNTIKDTGYSVRCIKERE